MQKRNSGTSAEGRTPPPDESKFRKGRSGHPAGRPKGSISLSRLTRKVALKKHRVRIDGKPRNVTMFDLQILKLKGLAATGQAEAAALLNWLRSQTGLSDAESAEGGFLLVPADVTPEEFMAEIEACYVGKIEPGTEVDVKTEEFLKAARGEPSPLGEALRSFYAKYGAGPAL
jgi:hypothetical protein